jgi:Spy/CpxP family protein refolding chaperone
MHQESLYIYGGSMKKYLAAMLIVAFVGVIKAQDHSEEPPMTKPMAHMEKESPWAKLKLTDEQKKQMKELRFETEKKAIDLRSKSALSKLELGRLLASDAPDKEAIEKKINEVAANETAVHINRLDGWFEANKFLTTEQQKVWREILRAESMKRMEHDRHEEMDHHEHP